jgi:hypothetical protein
VVAGSESRRYDALVNYSVLLKDSVADHLDKVGPAVAAVYQMAPIDANTRLRKGWGFLERDVPQEEARQIVESLASHGVQAVAIPNAELREATEPKVILGFQADADGFTPLFQSPQETAQLINWHDVAIVAAGGFAEEVIRRDVAPKSSGTAKMIGIGVLLVTGIPTRGMFGGKKRKQGKPTKTSHFINFGEVITTDGQALFFNPDHFDFSGLGEKKQLNASLNYRTLIAEFARLTSARINLGARYLLEHKSLTLANYHGLKDFETELLWMINTM